MIKLEKVQPFGHSKASKIKKVPHIAHFPRPGESDPYTHTFERPQMGQNVATAIWRSEGKHRQLATAHFEIDIRDARVRNF